MSRDPCLLNTRWQPRNIRCQSRLRAPQIPTPANLTESFRFVAVMNSNTKHKAMSKGNRYTFGGEAMSFTC